MISKTSVTHPTIRRAIWQASIRAIKTGISQPVFNSNGVPIMTIRCRTIATKFGPQKRCFAFAAGTLDVTHIAAHAISLGCPQ